MAVAYLRVRGTASLGQTLSISNELILGRESFAEFKIADTKVSRRHARIFITPQGQVWVEDLGSTNGTFVNGGRIDRVAVRLGDQIRIGQTTLELVAAAESVPPAPPAPPRERDRSTRVMARPTAGSPTGGSPAQPPVRPIVDSSARTVIPGRAGVPGQAGAPGYAATPGQPGAPGQPAVAAQAGMPGQSMIPGRPGAPGQAGGAAPGGPAAGPGGAAAPTGMPAQAGVAVQERPSAPVLLPVPKVRTALPPFPNYTQIPPLLSVRGWWVVRTGVLAVTLTIAALLIADPPVGLRIFWGIAIPLLPIFFFVAPGVWRNICPLAASNQLPRALKFTRAMTPPGWLKRYSYAISISFFFIFVSLRKIGLQESGLWSGLLLLAVIVSPFTGGMLFKGKSGWCSSICPLLPVQRVYGQTPFLLVANTHCQPCVGCAKNCYDFNPKVAYLADLQEEPSWSAGRKFFVAAFPGLILGFFRSPSVPKASIALVYGELGLYVAASVAIFFLLDSFVRVSTHKLTTLYAATALNIFYWFAFPVIVKSISGIESPMALTWAARAVVLGLTLWWIARTYRKERLFLAQGSSPAPAPASASAKGGGARTDSIASHSMAARGKPEVTFLPGDRRIMANTGQTLLELAEANDLQIEAGCRMGICGADPVAIVAGMSNLSGISDDEQATLERLGLAENTRMACCCRVNGPVSVSLTPEQPEVLRPSQVLRLDYDRSIERVVVVGNGIAGITAADYVRRNHPETSVDVIADEAYHLYNRMAITRLIYGRSAMQGLYLNPDAWYESRSITPWLNTRVQAIDRTAQEIVTGTGERLKYDRLILATGSSSMVPPIEGWGASGTFVLRSAEDALRVRAFAQLQGARRAVIAGGGLLGLEAAYALHKLGLATVVLERSDRLLRRQLDARASQLLHRYLEGIGIAIWTKAETAAVEANGRLAEIVLTDARTTPADVLIVAAGISPNIDLAREAGLATKKGIIVDAHMRTSDERIFAAGDAAEFPGQPVGLWPTAVDQGRVAGEGAVRRTVSTYTGTIPVTVLKVVGVDLTSIGQFEPGSDSDEVIVFEDESALRYGKLVISDGKIVGAILLGYSREVAPVTSAVKQIWDVTGVLSELRAGRWDALERLGSDRVLSSVSVVGG
jgi:nitrite reductase (NADH) large subunit